MQLFLLVLNALCRHAVLKCPDQDPAHVWYAVEVSWAGLLQSSVGEIRKTTIIAGFTLFYSVNSVCCTSVIVGRSLDLLVVLLLVALSHAGWFFFPSKLGSWGFYFSCTLSPVILSQLHMW